MDEYFKRDLTDAEEQQLADRLAADPQEASLFAQGMAAHYKECGLAEPVWPGGSLPFPRSRGWKKWLFLLLLVPFSWSYHHWASQPSSAPQSGTMEPASGRSTPQKQPAATAPKRSSGTKYQELSVVVNQRQAGLVTVRVVDAQDNLIRTLYAGILKPGNPSFTWDGKTERGVLAPAGRYFVEVKSGKDLIRKEVKVEPEKP